MAGGLIVDRIRLERALLKTRTELLAERNRAGYWTGELSSSALSTATTVAAMAIMDRALQSAHFANAISAGLNWLAMHANPDGGWGDTKVSRTNLSTTTLCWAAFGAVAGADEQFSGVIANAQRWLRNAVGSEN